MHLLYLFWQNILINEKLIEIARVLIPASQWQQISVVGLIDFIGRQELFSERDICLASTFDHLQIDNVLEEVLHVITFFQSGFALLWLSDKNFCSFITGFDPPHLFSYAQLGQAGHCLFTFLYDLDVVRDIELTLHFHAVG